jgi:phosphoribosylanthranilate isomerase
VSPRPIVKFCGLTRQEDLSFAESLGADVAGFILHPESPRGLSPEAAGRLKSKAILRAGVFVRQRGPEIVGIMKAAGLSLAQLHGAQTEEDAETIGPDRVIRVVWPERFESPDGLAAELLRWRGLARWLLFDAGQSGGGHGRSLGAGALGCLGESPAPVILAGGLGPDSVRGLWPPEEPNLAGFDFNSGVEAAPGRKDHALMRRVFAELGGERGPLS